MAKPTGRPPKITPELIDEICTRLACGQSLSSICRRGKKGLTHIPRLATVIRWLAKGDPAAKNPIGPTGPEGENLYQTFRAQYERARCASAEVGLEQIMAVEARMLLPARIPNADYDPKLGRRADNPKFLSAPGYIDPQTARTLIDSIKWRMGRMMPVKYGDVTKVQLSGGLELKTPKDQAPSWVTERLAAPSPGTITSAVQQPPDGETVH